MPEADGRFRDILHNRNKTLTKSIIEKDGALLFTEESIKEFNPESKSLVFIKKFLKSRRGKVADSLGDGSKVLGVTKNHKFPIILNENFIIQGCFQRFSYSSYKGEGIYVMDYGEDAIVFKDHL